MVIRSHLRKTRVLNDLQLISSDLLQVFPGHPSASDLGTGPSRPSTNASSHAICFESGSVNFCFKWRHRDGSTVEFSPAKGWTSDDPMKTERLSKLNQLSSATPVIPPSVLNWLQEECYLIDVSTLGSSPE